MGERRGRVIKEHVYTTHGQSQRVEGLKVEGGGRWSRGKWWQENGDNCTPTTIKKKHLKSQEKKNLSFFSSI